MCVCKIRRKKRADQVFLSSGSISIVHVTYVCARAKDDSAGASVTHTSSTAAGFYYACVSPFSRARHRISCRTFVNCIYTHTHVLSYLRSTADGRILVYTGFWRQSGPRRRANERERPCRRMRACVCVYEGNRRHTVIGETNERKHTG